MTSLKAGNASVEPSVVGVSAECLECCGALGLSPELPFLVATRPPNSSLLDFIVPGRNTLLQAPLARLATLPACYGLLAGAQPLSIALRLSGLAQLTLGPLLRIPIQSSRLGMAGARTALDWSLCPSAAA